MKQKSTTSTNVVLSRLSRSAVSHKAWIVSDCGRQNHGERKPKFGVDWPRFYLNASLFFLSKGSLVEEARQKKKKSLCHPKRPASVVPIRLPENSPFDLKPQTKSESYFEHQSDKICLHQGRDQATSCNWRTSRDP